MVTWAVHMETRTPLGAPLLHPALLVRCCKRVVNRKVLIKMNCTWIVK